MRRSSRSTLYVCRDPPRRRFSGLALVLNLFYCVTPEVVWGRREEAHRWIEYGMVLVLGLAFRNGVVYVA
jgi:hypothetical protein